MKALIFSCAQRKVHTQRAFDERREADAARHPPWREQRLEPLHADLAGASRHADDRAGAFAATVVLHANVGLRREEHLAALTHEHRVVLEESEREDDCGQHESSRDCERDAAGEWEAERGCVGRAGEQEGGGGGGA